MVTGPLLLAYIRSPSSLSNYYTPFLELMYDAIGFLLFLTVGALVLEHYKGRNQVLPDLKDNEPGVALGVMNSPIFLSPYDCWTK